MEKILYWGLDVVRAVQSAANPVFTLFFRFITFLGSEYLFLLVIPLVYWCVDRTKGIRLGILVITSAVLNAWLKVLFAQPRPYDLDPSVKMAHEPSRALPSGHSQHSATLWGGLAPWIRRPWGLILALVLPLLIGFSRVYLGVHFPTDVFLGWALGYVFAAAHALWGNYLQALAARLPGRAQVILAAAAALGMNALNREETGLPGLLFGAVAGAVLASSRALFDASAGTTPRKALRFLAGASAAAVLYFGLKVLLPGRGSELYGLFRFVRYGILGVWMTLGAPWLFLRLGLAETSPTRRE